MDTSVWLREKKGDKNVSGVLCLSSEVRSIEHRPLSVCVNNKTPLDGIDSGISFPSVLRRVPSSSWPGSELHPPARQPLLTITRQPTSLHLFTHFPPSEVTHPSHQATRCNCNSQRLAHNLEKTLFKSIYQFEDKHISMLSPQSLEQTRMLHYSTSWYFIEAEEEVKTCPQLWRWQERSWRL